MHAKDLTFTVIFVTTLVVLLYFLGVSITGYVAQSMYCEKGICREFCRFDSDCINGKETCCQKDDFGVCEVSSICEKPYVFQPESVDIESIEPITDIPSPVTKGKLGIYSLLFVLAIIIAIIYFSKRRRHLT